MRLRCLLPVLLAVAACADDPTDPSADAAEVTAAPAPAVTASPRAAIAPGQVIVQLRHDYDGVAAIELGGRRLAPIKRLPSGTWLMRLDDDRHARIADPAADDRDTLDAIVEVGADPAVEYAHANRAFAFSTEPNDPEARQWTGRQHWSLNQIGMYDAWARTTGVSTMRIALIDTGRRDHPELINRWAPGRDFIGGSDDPTDFGSWAHGIHVAGIVGAEANNGIGGAGLCWNCQIIPLRVTPLQSEIEEAITWAAGGATGVRRADVVNMSLNDRFLSDCNDVTFTGLRTAIALANTRGVVLVGSAGNLVFEGPNTSPTWHPRVPSTCAGVISVVATDPTDTVPLYSAHGVGAALSAPGGGTDLDMHYGDGVDCPEPIFGSGTTGVFSSWSYRDGGDRHCYRYLSGTSMAAPHVAGTVALMRSVRDLSPAQVAAVLRLTASPPQGFPGWGFICTEQNGCGAGRLNANAAIDAIDSGSPVIAAVTPPQHEYGVVAATGSATRNFALGNIGFAALTVSSAAPMWIDGGNGWFSFAYGSGECTTGQTCNRTFTVPVNTTSNIPIRCTPGGAMGDQTAELVIPSNTVGGQVRVQLWCSSSRLTATPTPLSFGDVTVGQLSDRNVTFMNTSTRPMVLTSAGVTVAGSGFSRIGNPAATIPPYGTKEITVRCAPTAAGTVAGTLTITSGTRSTTVELSCRGVVPPFAQLAVNPLSLPFGDVQINTSRDLSTTAFNTGNALLTLSSVVEGPDFLLVSAPSSIAAGGNAPITVRCTPTILGDRTGTLRITSNGGNVNVGLTCRGTSPPSPDITVTPLTINFPAQAINTVSSPQNVIVRNDGVGTLTFSASVNSGHFNATCVTGCACGSGICSGSLTAGQQATLAARFTPATGGDKIASLAITANDPDEPTTSVILMGRGTIARAEVTPKPLDAGLVTIGNVGLAEGTLRNSGEATLEISHLALQQTGTVFTLAEPCDGQTACAFSTPLAGGAWIPLRVRCTPTTLGVHTATLIVTSNGTNSPSAHPIICTAVGPPLLAVAPTSLAFGDVRVGSAASRRTELQNLGTGPLTITALNVLPATGPFRGVHLPSPPFQINPGGSVPVDVVCEPTAMGTFSGGVLVMSTGGNLAVSLSCRGVAPSLSVVSNVQLPDVLLGSSSSSTIHLANVGTAALAITSATLVGQGFSMTPVPTTIPHGTSPTVTLTCAPSTIGWKTGTLTLVHDGATSPTTIALSCRATTGRIVVLEPSDGELELVPFVPQQATIRNDGVGPLEIAELGFSETGFTASGATLPATLAVGETLSWWVTCDSGKWLGTTWAKQFAKHDGLSTGSLFSVSCSYLNDGGSIELPVGPDDPVDAPPTE